MAYLTHCCGCMTVRTGTMVLAILNMIGSATSLAAASVLAGFLKSTANIHANEPSLYRAAMAAFALLVLLAIISSVVFIAACLCLWGVRRDNRLCVLPFLICQLVDLVFRAILVIFLIAVLATTAMLWSPGTLTSLVVSMLLEIYFLWVVVSYYKQLEFAERNPGVGTMPAAQVVPPMTYVPPPSAPPSAPGVRNSGYVV
ncbi:lysosomal-associated transmembrane protein 4A-like [Ixodes scapularis]|uniref:lysosomal-associated transmembrane protein 4A-like n=1 Tax=Ixodes scapularis TaxID=6945 RepID=UPI001A9F7C1F|nr:lysosomal-associated transmembrane protein 4A-like [Ixodes scapularis]